MMLKIKRRTKFGKNTIHFAISKCKITLRIMIHHIQLALVPDVYLLNSMYIYICVYNLYICYLLYFYVYICVCITYISVK